MSTGWSEAGWGAQIGRRWLGWIYDFLELDVQAREAIRADVEAGGSSPLPARPGVRYLLARSLAMVQAQSPGVFLAFPIALLVILGHVAAWWIKVF